MGLVAIGLAIACFIAGRRHRAFTWLGVLVLVAWLVAIGLSVAVGGRLS